MEKTLRKSVVTALAALASAAVFGAVTGSITTEGGATQKGVIRWSMRDKAYAVTTKGGIEIQVKAADVAELAIDKPAALDAAAAQVEKGQGKAAIGALQKLVKDYAHLQWDKVAGGSWKSSKPLALRCSSSAARPRTKNRGEP